jgi:hypothetical protein
MVVELSVGVLSVAVLGYTLVSLRHRKKTMEAEAAGKA